MRRFVVATAGHVDHGKSSLVKALTGTDPDRLPEEKARQITIELGFAELNLGNELHAAMVDVPGHEDFVRNMIAGVGSIDLVLLVVAADDGWMPQTEEHLQILEYLAVKHAVVALTKADLAGESDRVGHVRQQLQGTRFEASPIVLCSVRTNAGLDELRRAIALELSRASPSRDIGKPRLAIDRAFTLHGIGTVVTGTLSGGRLRRGEMIAIQPRGLNAHIRTIQSHGRDVDLALPGTRTALNLPEVRPVIDVARGNMVVGKGFDPTDVLEVMLLRSGRTARKMPLKSGCNVYLHHGTTHISARIVLSGEKTLAAGEQGLARLQLKTPIMAFVGDRFVLRDASQQHTLAGGVVLAVRSHPADLRKPHHQRWLLARFVGINDVDLCLQSELQRCGCAKISGLLRESRFSANEISDAAHRLHEQEKIFVAEDAAADRETWKNACHRATTLIDRAHVANPERTGIEVADLRAALSNLPPTLIDLVMAKLCEADFAKIGSTVSRRSHHPSATGPLAAAAEEIRQILLQRPFDPPSRKQIENDQTRLKAVRFLCERAEVVEIASDLIILSDTYATMRERLSQFLSQRDAATVSELRQELGTSRRVIVPFLERLDREGVTRRLGDKRVLAKPVVTDPGASVR